MHCKKKMLLFGYYNCATIPHSLNYSIDISLQYPSFSCTDSPIA